VFRRATISSSPPITTAHIANQPVSFGRDPPVAGNAGSVLVGAVAVVGAAVVVVAAVAVVGAAVVVAALVDGAAVGVTALLCDDGAESPPRPRATTVNV
jgi:hypothetical protein